jgi:hypothetical protein
MSACQERHEDFFYDDFLTDDSAGYFSAEPGGGAKELFPRQFVRFRCD